MKNDVSQIFDSIGTFVEGGGDQGQKPPQNWVLQDFQEVLSLNIGDTEQDTVGP